MTTAAADLRAALVAHAPLASVVGDRVRFDMGREGDPHPLVVLRQVADQPERGLDGSLHGRLETFEVESWADTRAQAASVHRLVEAALAAAEFDVEAADPDAIDPEVGARACVWSVPIWSTS